MVTYPEHVTPTIRRAAERFYRRLPHLHIPTGYDFDDLIELPDDRDLDGNHFRHAATPERED